MEALAEIWNQGGHWSYVVVAYGIAAITVILNVWAPMSARKAIEKEIQRTIRREHHSKGNSVDRSSENIVQ